MKHRSGKWRRAVLLRLWSLLERCVRWLRRWQRRIEARIGDWGEELAYTAIHSRNDESFVEDDVPPHWAALVAARAPWLLRHARSDVAPPTGNTAIRGVVENIRGKPAPLDAAAPPRGAVDTVRRADSPKDSHKSIATRSGWPSAEAGVREEQATNLEALESPDYDPRRRTMLPAEVVTAKQRDGIVGPVALHAADASVFRNLWSIRRDAAEPVVQSPHGHIRTTRDPSQGESAEDEGDGMQRLAEAPASHQVKTVPELTAALSYKPRPVERRFGPLHRAPSMPVRPAAAMRADAAVVMWPMLPDEDDEATVTVERWPTLPRAKEVVPDEVDNDADHRSGEQSWNG